MKTNKPRLINKTFEELRKNDTMQNYTVKCDTAQHADVQCSDGIYACVYCSDFQSFNAFIR